MGCEFPNGEFPSRKECRMTNRTVIGVACSTGEEGWVREFFELYTFHLPRRIQPAVMGAVLSTFPGWGNPLWTWWPQSLEYTMAHVFKLVDSLLPPKSFLVQYELKGKSSGER